LAGVVARLKKLFTVDGNERMLRYAAYTANTHAIRRQLVCGSDFRRPLREFLRRSLLVSLDRRSGTGSVVSATALDAMQPERQTATRIAAPFFTLEMRRASQTMTLRDARVTLCGLDLPLHNAPP